jgi:Protein of unknown function (DUF3461)
MKTPTLTEMGINNPSEITRYTLSKPSEYVDELTIYYKRQKGSLLPVRRAYEFGRAVRSAVADSGTGRIASFGDISPRLLEAVAELDRLLGHKDSYEHRKGAVLEQLGTVREALASRALDADLEKRLAEVEESLRKL